MLGIGTTEASKTSVVPVPTWLIVSYWVQDIWEYLQQLAECHPLTYDILIENSLVLLLWG